MAKVKFYPSPLNKNEVQIHELSNISILEVIQKLKLEKESLSISLNGEIPDEIDLNYILKIEDEIIIIKPLFGNSSSTKRTLAIVINIAAIVFSMGKDVTAWQRLGVLLASSVVTGALNTRAAQLDAAATASVQDSQIDTATNSYSLTNINNEVRPLRPVPIPMGSHRQIPDIYAQAFKDVFNDSNVFSEVAPIVESFIPGITFDNGATADGSSWINIPSGFVETKPTVGGSQTYYKFPQYDIKIAPFFYNIEKGSLTPSLESYARENFKARILQAWNSFGGAHNYASRISWNDYVPSSSSDIIPMVIYHSDPADPYFGSYNILFTIARAYELNRARVEYPFIIPSNYNYYDDISHFFAGTFTTYQPTTNHKSYQQRFFRFPNDIFGTNDEFDAQSLYGTTPKERLKVGSGSYYYPSGIGASDWIGPIMDEMEAFLSSINDGLLSPANKTLSFDVEVQKRNFAITSVEDEGIDYSTQVFNYGIGDLSIYDRKVGSTDVGLSDSISAFSKINKTDWEIPSLVLDHLTAMFFSKIHGGENKKLSNIDSPDVPIPVNDLNQYNFIYFEGALGEGICTFIISGKIYSTSTSTGFASNSCTIEAQWKYNTDEVWNTSEFSGILEIQNNNSKTINFRSFVGDGFISQDQRLQVRIRKITLDSDNNNENKVCDLYVTKVFTFSYENIGLSERHIPLNLEGLFMTALLNDKAQAERFHSMVEASCWYYDFENEEWVWGLTRNPAWWFLFFAHGGFINPASSYDWNTYVYPYSPTQGWVNYPDHPDNTEHIFGAGLKNEEIDLEQILNWAQFCDENNLKFDMILKDDTSCDDILERIANVGRGSVTYYNGLLSVVYENPNQVPTCMFGMGNIKAGTFSVEYLVSDPVSKVRCSFVNRESWDTEQVESYVPFQNSENIKTLEVNLEGVTERGQAQRECNLLAARQFFQRRTYSFDVDIEGMLAKRGDLVFLSHDSTQYGVSGRIFSFIFDGGQVVGIKTNSVLNSTIKYITIRSPNGVLDSYEVLVDGENIKFIDEYPKSLSPYYFDGKNINYESSFVKSIPEDFVFIAGEKETAGKVVRIASIESSGDFDFKITAVDEDPAMYSYEFENIDENDMESFKNSEVEMIVENASVLYLESGKVKILWSGKNCDLVKIINKISGLPVEGSGNYTFSNGEAILDLEKGNYRLEIIPFSVGTPFKSVSKEVSCII